MKIKLKKYFWATYLIVVVAFGAFCFNVVAGPSVTGGGGGGGSALSEEQVEDFVGGMLGGTETGIGVAYNDEDNDIDFVVSTILQKYHAIDPADDVELLLACATEAAIRTLLDLEAGVDFYSVSGADTAFEVQLTNENGLYAVLSNVSNFLQDNEGFTGQVTVQAFGADDATPDVSLAALITNNVYQTANANPTTITDFDDGAGAAHSEFADGDWFILRVDDANTTIDFSANSDIEGNAGVDFTGSTTQIVYILFLYESARWNAVNFTSGFSTPTTLAVSSLNMASGVFAAPNSTNPTTDSVGEISLDESDGGQEPLFYEAYDDGTGNCSRIIASDVVIESFTILEPDLAQAACDDIKLKHFIAEGYPFGITIFAIHIVTDGTDISDTFLFEGWSNADGGTQTTIESIALSGTDTGEDDGTLSDDDAIVADWFLNLNLDDASDNYKSVTVTIAYRINPGD